MGNQMRAQIWEDKKDRGDIGEVERREGGRV